MDNEETVYKECGYDESLDYEKYPTFQILTGQEKINSLKERDYINAIKEGGRSIIDSPTYKESEQNMAKLVEENEWLKQQIIKSENENKRIKQELNKN